MHLEAKLITQDGQIVEAVAKQIFEQVSNTDFLQKERADLVAYIDNIENIKQARDKQNALVQEELSRLQDEVTTQQIKIEGTQSQLADLENLLAHNDNRNDVFSQDTLVEIEEYERLKQQMAHEQSCINEMTMDMNRMYDIYRAVFGIQLVNENDDKIHVIIHKALRSDPNAVLTVTCRKNPFSVMSVSPELCGADTLITAVNNSVHRMDLVTFLSTCREVFRRQFD